MPLPALITMILDPHTAAKFINTYKQLLLAIDADESLSDAKTPVLQRMVAARKKLLAEPHLKNSYLAGASQNDAYDKDILAAIGTLKVESWVFLRDTRSYSVFIQADGSCAYGVLGLTDRIRDIVGGSGVYFETGIVEVGRRYICDGLIAGMVMLGKGYKQSYTEILAGLRQQGKFRTQSGGCNLQSCAPGATSVRETQNIRQRGLGEISP